MAEADNALYEEKQKRFIENIEELEARNEALTAQVSQIQVQIKTAGEDEQSTAILLDSLRLELDEIRKEKAIIGKRLESLRVGMELILQDRETRLPHLKEYNDICRQVRTVLKDAQNRMEVSLKLIQRWDS
jgi:uncharacterized protein (UPF0335 family)